MALKKPWAQSLTASGFIRCVTNNLHPLTHRPMMTRCSQQTNTSTDSLCFEGPPVSVAHYKSNIPRQIQNRYTHCAGTSPLHQSLHWNNISISVLHFFYPISINLPKPWVSLCEGWIHLYLCCCFRNVFFSVASTDHKNAA